MGDLATLRARAQDAVAIKQYDVLLEMSDDLRGDGDYWATWFAPECAIAARSTGRDDARAFLDEAISGGFAQYELFPHLVELFSVDRDWTDLVARMDANIPRPPLELLEWPSPTPGLPLDLDALDAGRAAALSERLPEAADGAWETVLDLLGWVTTRWSPGGDAIASRDALDILDRVTGRERFGSPEYTVVLSQALNARGIPARSVGLMAANYHSGFGRGHNVTEAWIEQGGEEAEPWTSARDRLLE
jgi:hypothetical protein